MGMYNGAFGPKIYLLGVIGKCKWHLGVGRLISGAHHNFR